MQSHAFFDVDSLKLSPNGRTYVCNPQMTSVSEELFDIYNLISAIFSPLVFSVDVNGSTPDKAQGRKDFSLIPASKAEEDWKHNVAEKFKFYVQREAADDKEKEAVFNSNENLAEMVKTIKKNEWYVFGSGLKYGLDHVVFNLLSLVKTVKFIPELIVPGEGETDEQRIKYMMEWEEMGAQPVSYEKVLNLSANKKPKFRM